MLQKFGEHIRGWFAGVFVAIIAVAFVIWGLQYYIESNQAAAAVAVTVNGQAITEAAFSTQLQLEQRQQEKSLGHPLNDDDLLMLKRMLINQMIGRTILTQAIHHMGFSVNSDAIKASIEQMPQFQNNGVFSPDQFQEMLYQMGYSTPHAFFAFAADSVLIQQLLSGIRDTAFVLPNELQTAYGLWKQTRDFSFTLIPASLFTKKVAISDKEIEQYYHSNQSAFSTPEKVQVNYIVLSPEALTRQVTVADSDVSAYYDANKSNFMVPATWKIARVIVPTRIQADALLAQLQKGKMFGDFKPVVQTIHAADAAPSLITLLTSLHVNQVSQPLPTSQGVALVQLVAVAPPHVRPFSDVKDQIKNSLISQQVAQLLASKSEQLSNLTYTNPTTLTVAAKQLGIPVQISPWLTKDVTLQGVFSNPTVLAAAFSPDVLVNGNNSNPLSLKDGSVVVIHRAVHMPSAEKPLASVQSDIVAALTAQTALRLAGLQAYTLESQLNKGQQKMVQWTTRVNATRSDATVDKMILQAVFGASVNQIKAVQLTNGYALVKVTAVHPAAWNQATVAEKNALKASLIKMRGQNEFQLYLKDMIKNAKVIIKDKALAGSWQ